LFLDHPSLRRLQGQRSRLRQTAPTMREHSGDGGHAPTRAPRSSSAAPSSPWCRTGQAPRGPEYVPLREALVPRALVVCLKDVPLQEAPERALRGRGARRRVHEKLVSRPVIALVLDRLRANVASRTFHCGKLSLVRLSSSASKTFHYGRLGLLRPLVCCSLVPEPTGGGGAADHAESTPGTQRPPTRAPTRIVSRPVVALIGQAVRQRGLTGVPAGSSRSSSSRLWPRRRSTTGSSDSSGPSSAAPLSCAT